MTRFYRAVEKLGSALTNWAKKRLPRKSLEDLCKERLEQRV